MPKNLLIIVMMVVTLNFSGPAQTGPPQTDEAGFFDKALKTCLAKNSSADRQEQCLEKALAECTEQYPSTGGEASCNARAYQLWDQELNKIYNELLGKVTPKESKALKAAQKQWLKYRDAEFELIDQIKSTEGDRGSMFVPFSIYARMKVVRTRALELKNYSDTYMPPN